MMKLGSSKFPCWLGAIEDAPLPSSLASEPRRSSCWRGRCPQPGDQRQDVGEHLPRHGDLRHLERDVAAVADDFRADHGQVAGEVVKFLLRARAALVVSVGV
jgi:hypothetical protein